MTFSLVLEELTPVIILPTIYIMLWMIKRLSPLRMIKNLRWESQFLKNSWMQSRNQGLWSSFSPKITHFSHGAWKNLQRLLNIWIEGYWQCCPFSTMWNLLTCDIRRTLLQRPLQNIKSVLRRTQKRCRSGELL